MQNCDLATPAPHQRESSSRDATGASRSHTFWTWRNGAPLSLLVAGKVEGQHRAPRCHSFSPRRRCAREGCSPSVLPDAHLFFFCLTRLRRVTVATLWLFWCTCHRLTVLFADRTRSPTMYTIMWCVFTCCCMLFTHRCCNKNYIYFILLYWRYHFTLNYR